jgi:hypothetical protein
MFFLLISRLIQLILLLSVCIAYHWKGLDEAYTRDVMINVTIVKIIMNKMKRKPQM